MAKGCGKWVSDNDPTGPTSERCRRPEGHDGACRGFTVGVEPEKDNGTPVLFVDRYNVLRDALGREVRMYAVTLVPPGKRGVTVHVIATCESEAKDQAECVVGWRGYGWVKDSDKLSKGEYEAMLRYVVPCPVALRGWGRNQW